MSSTNQQMIKTIPLYTLFGKEEQSIQDCSLSNEENFGKKTEMELAQERQAQMEEEIAQLREMLIEEAEFQAEKIIQGAKTKAIEIEEQSKEKGYQVGYEEGFLKGVEGAVSEYQEKADELKSVLASEYRSFIEETNRELKQEGDAFVLNVVNLIRQSLDKLLHEVNAVGTVRVESIVREMADDLLDCGVISIRTSIDRVDALKETLKELGIMDGKRRVRVTHDSSLAETDCVIETEKEKLEFRLNDELEDLIKELERVNA